jgi:hypothetical protein
VITSVLVSRRGADEGEPEMWQDERAQSILLALKMEEEATSQTSEKTVKWTLP